MSEVSDTLKVSPTNFLGTGRQNILTENRDTPFLPPFLIQKIFRYQIFRETQKGSPTKVFGTVRKQLFYRKL